MKIICALFLLGCLCHQISAGIDESHETMSLVAEIRKNLLVSQDKANWYGAIKRCRLRGMHLVSIHSEKENDYLKEQISPAESGYWTSGTDFRTFPYNFEWMGSGEVITTNSYTNWKNLPKDVDGHCVAFLSNGQWLNTNCSAKKKYICEIRNLNCSD